MPHDGTCRHKLILILCPICTPDDNTTMLAKEIVRGKIKTLVDWLNKSSRESVCGEENIYDSVIEKVKEIFGE